MLPPWIARRSRPRAPCLDEPVGAGDEVVEHVLLLREAARRVPRPRRTRRRRAGTRPRRRRRARPRARSPARPARVAPDAEAAVAGEDQSAPCRRAARPCGGARNIGIARPVLRLGYVRPGRSSSARHVDRRAGRLRAVSGRPLRVRHVDDRRSTDGRTTRTRTRPACRRASSRARRTVPGREHRYLARSAPSSSITRSGETTSLPHVHDHAVAGEAATSSMTPVPCGEDRLATSAGSPTVVDAWTRDRRRRGASRSVRRGRTRPPPCRRGDRADADQTGTEVVGRPCRTELEESRASVGLAANRGRRVARR